jgi:hypothetical protein
LAHFENNESTAAFAGLAMAQEIQKKVDVQNDILNPEDQENKSAEQIEKDFKKLSSSKKKEAKDAPPNSEAI